MIRSPCQGCPDRTVEPNCHTTCEPYLAFKAERAKISDRRASEHAIYDARFSSIEKNLKKQGRPVVAR